MIVAIGHHLQQAKTSSHREDQEAAVAAAISRAAGKNVIMADPFEVRMRFSLQLQHLNASVTSAQKAAQYAIKYKDMDEDLHSCIIEQIEKVGFPSTPLSCPLLLFIEDGIETSLQNNMNTRANIMYFIEHFLEMATEDRHNDYVRMMQRDIIRVVDAVCPEDGSGAANVKVVRKVLQGLVNKSLLPNETVDELEECLKERDTFASDIGLSSPVNGDASSMTDVNTHPSSRPRNGASAPPGLRLDKRQIEQRIEEDRERHKRMRESMWTVPTQASEEAFKFYDEASATREDDGILGKEEQEEIHHEGKGVPCHHQSKDRVNGVSSNQDSEEM
ncbi:hypothetical protein DL771_007222 [Monosporascus sp. 5C6A]|nr:hypothetical protein DL771_007222 [Monosporascus sp. 5C6A]